MHYAVRHGGMACLRILLGEGCADEQVRTLSGGDRRRLPAHEAAIAGDLDALALLLQRAPHEQLCRADGDGNLPAHWAARQHNEACLGLLLRSGFAEQQALARNHARRLPLHEAA